MGAWKMLKNRIREYRAKYDMKQKDLAKLVGVRRETIGKLEKGKMCIRDRHIKNIRAKLRPTGESPIETVWGVGYKWKNG